jgi:nicotinamide-nucleotide amidase
MLDPTLVGQAESLLSRMRSAGLKLVTIESCTGGLIAALLTEVAGSSDVFERGFVTYSNDAKAETLGVPRAILRKEGAVSSATVRAMVTGGLAHAHADVAVAVTGIAGPGGGGPDKPVGLVYLAAARQDREPIVLERRYGDLGRSAVRRATVEDALRLIALALN